MWNINFKTIHEAKLLNSIGFWAAKEAQKYTKEAILKVFLFLFFWKYFKIFEVQISLRKGFVYLLKLFYVIDSC